MVHDVVVLSRGVPRVIPAEVTFEEIPAEREEFEVTFECHHCHHQWKETVTKVEKGELPSESDDDRVK